MTDDNNETNSTTLEFDFSSFPPNTLFHERRNGRDRRNQSPTVGEQSQATNTPGPGERRARKERRRRVDPTTFERQYTDDEMEFMNAMQRFKELSGKSFPTHGEVIKVAVALGYRRSVVDIEPPTEGLDPKAPTALHTTLVEN